LGVAEVVKTFDRFGAETKTLDELSYLRMNYNE
jgi:hypothetical protein